MMELADFMWRFGIIILAVWAGMRGIKWFRGGGVRRLRHRAEFRRKHPGLVLRKQH